MFVSSTMHSVKEIIVPVEDVQIPSLRSLSPLTESDPLAESIVTPKTLIASSPSSVFVALPTTMNRIFRVVCSIVGFTSISPTVIDNAPSKPASTLASMPRMGMFNFSRTSLLIILICALQSMITGSRFPSEVVRITRVSDGPSYSDATQWPSPRT